MGASRRRRRSTSSTSSAAAWREPDGLGAPGVVARTSGWRPWSAASGRSRRRARGASHPRLPGGPGAPPPLPCLLATYVRWHVGRASHRCSPGRDTSCADRCGGTTGRSTGTRTKERLHRTPDGLRFTGSQPARRPRHPHPQTDGPGRGRRGIGVRHPRRGHTAPGTRHGPGGSPARVARARQSGTPHPCSTRSGGAGSSG